MLKSPKYSLPEIERRFLVLPDWRTPGAGFDGWLIEDQYVEDTRLRLRTMTNHETGERVFKLCKKYESNDPLSASIVNIYLTREEHAALTILGGRRIRKHRFRLDDGARFSIDYFSGPLTGLVLAEIEFPDGADSKNLAVPHWAAREVTGEPFYRGGNLAHTSAPELARRLAREHQTANLRPPDPGTR